MNGASLDELSVIFDRLADLPVEQRMPELARLSIDEGDRQRLERMLSADADDDDPLGRIIAMSAARIGSGNGDRLGAWRLIREIGAGGMGTVFLAERADGGFSQHVAIKLLRGFPTRDGIRRLRQERQILAGLEHANIARLLDGGESSDGQPWLAIEYVDGVPLLDYVRDHAPTLRQRFALFSTMLDAIEHAHQRLVIHRDLKPANVLVTHEGVLKLLDFGIARLVESNAEALRDTSTQVFSRGYASPEQRAGSAVTTASDIYSLGVILRELLTGSRDEEQVEAPRVAALELDVELAGVIAKANADEPGGRYGSVGEFREDLDRYLDGRPVRATPLTRRYRLRKFAVRHRIAVAAGMLGVIVLAAFVWELDRERQRAQRAEQTAQRALQASERDAQRARASLEFLTDAFTAASPEVAMSRQVSVRDLLDAARAKLEKRAVGNADLQQSMQRLLARLYHRLGEVTVARDLMRDGLAGLAAVDGPTALKLADDYEEYAGLLGSTDDGPGAMDAAERAARWRRQYAPDDHRALVQSLHTLAVAHHRNGHDERAIELLRESLAVARAHSIDDVQIMIESTQTLAALLAASGDCAGALQTAESGLELARRSLDANSPDQLTLMRAKASALSACGRPADAEVLLREALDLRERTVSSGGLQAMILTNDIAITLNDQGRYQEAAAMLALSERSMVETGLGGSDAAVALMNRAGILENAGDYVGALEDLAHARNILDSLSVDADHPVRRRIERTEARTLGLSGQADRAYERLVDLRSRCARIEGEESGEYAMLTWQLALMARRTRQPDIGRALVDESEQRWAVLVPPEHPVFAHALRLRAAFALERNDVAEAERALQAALRSFEHAQVNPVDLAIARSELANVRMREGRVDDARQTLGLALPVLRGTLLATEVSRVEAERLASQIGGMP